MLFTKKQTHAVTSLERAHSIYVKSIKQVSK